MATPLRAISPGMTDERHTDTEVLYNADCPVCSVEIDHYAKIARSKSLPIAFSDLNDVDALKTWGLTREMAAKRLHVRQGDEILSGVPAFIALWRQMPRYRWLARVVNLPGVHMAAALVYDYVLAPVLYRWDRRRTAQS